MKKLTSREIRRFKYKGDPYYTYYSPDISVRSHDQSYILRLLSDSLAVQRPEDFNLLPQFRAS